ncbi:MAG TPA: threonine ammonia-lyase IlvA [Acidimicrobiales bacterium]|nr:threonine ammonia-lyase IlvA [Acidimicrobiales bacterium]
MTTVTGAEETSGDGRIPAWRDLVGLDDVRAAAERLAPVGVLTPLQRSDRLSERFSADVYLKREDLQAVRSYKIRGAYNFIAGLDAAALAAGVCCASAGNHAQGVAWSCRHLQVRGAVFLPRRTPRQKVARIRALAGALVDVRFAGDSFDDAYAAVLAYSEETGATVVPTFDHPLTVAGQGTIALELVDQLGHAPTKVVVPVGGGGLASGIAVTLDGLGASSEVIGVQPAGAPAMLRSLEVGHPVVIDITDDFIDGAVVRRPGALTFSIVGDLLPNLLVVEEGRVCTEQLALYQDDGIVAEPAGALAVAALDDLAGDLAGGEVVCILSGGNNDVARYDEIIERSLVHQGLKHYFIVAFPQQPGALRRFLDECLGPTDDIVLFEYIKKNDREFGPALVGVELAERHDLQPLLDRIAASGLDAQRVPPDSPVFHLLV